MRKKNQFKSLTEEEERVHLSEMLGVDIILYFSVGGAHWQTVVGQTGR